MIRIVRLSFETEHIENFKSLFEERKLKIRQFEGCSSLDLWQDKSQPGVFYTYSIWQQEHDLEAYRQSALFQDTWSQVKRWFKEPPQAFSADKLLSI
jgi:hypothetical protein